jgi:hypothetical protein
VPPIENKGRMEWWISISIFGRFYLINASNAMAQMPISENLICDWIQKKELILL